MTKKIHSVISFFLTFVVVSLLFLSGPAAAVTVSLTDPNDASQGSDVSFTLTVDINDPDTYLPIQYTNIIISGPDGFSQICKVNMDGTSDCSDVDVSVENNVGYDYGFGYGYDSRIGYGYSFGDNYGYGYGGAYGLITYTVIWHTTYSLITGTYTAKADVHAEGSDVHDYSSNVRSFSILNVPYNPPISCTENWQCSSWSSCLSSGVQTRSCADLSNCGTVNYKPAETQSCVFEIESTDDSSDDNDGSDRDTSHIKSPPPDLVFPDKPKVMEDKTEETIVVVKSAHLPSLDKLSLLQKIAILNVAGLFTALAVFFNPFKDKISNLRIK